MDPVGNNNTKTKQKRYRSEELGSDHSEDGTNYDRWNRL